MPWIHYIPIDNDFKNLNERIQWCIDNDEKCKKISENALKFVQDKLNWEYVIKFTVNEVKNVL
jgi:glycosyltransferase involved in cell wall biosynthesis